jgi:hypothetical protein
MGRRHLAIIAAFALGVTVVGGVAIAAGKPTQLQACANSKGVLALLTAKGTCRSGFSPVAISKRGPRGLAGAQGPRGKTGAAGPRGKAGTGGGAQSSIATTTTTTGKSVAIAGTKLAVKTTCTSGTNAKLVFTGAGDYFVHGVSNFAGTVNADADFPPSGTQDLIGLGSDLIDFESSSTSATATSDIALTGSGTGNLSTNLLVSDGSRTVTIDVFLMLGPSTCEAAAQITPTS